MSEHSDTKRCDAATMTHATTSHVCLVDDQPCEVVALFADRFDGDLREAMEKVEGWLPCQRCRAMEQNAARMTGVRLGKHERRVLLNAPSWEGEAKVIKPPAEGRAADEANRRAIRKLSRVGLIWIGWRVTKVATVQTTVCWGSGEEKNVKREYHKRAVWLTPLGEAAVERLRDDIAIGKSIRWTGHIAAMIAAARGRSAEMLVEFRAAVEPDQQYRRRLESLTAQGIVMGGNRELLERKLKRHSAAVAASMSVVKAIAGVRKVRRSQP